MAARSSTSSSLLPLFIDTNLDTHFFFTIDDHQSIAQLKGRIVSEHANCFPGLGEISVTAVKAKIGEFFYHLSDFIILNCFFQSVEGVKRFEIDIKCVPSTIKGSDQIKVNTDARMNDGQLENLEHLNCKSGDGASALFDAKMKENSQFDDASLKDSIYFKPRGIKKNVVSSNENNTSVDDSLLKINGTRSENPPEEILLKATNIICNNKCSSSYNSKILQLGTSVKGYSDIKHLMKKNTKESNNEENLLVNSSSHVMHRRKKKKKVASNEDNPLVNTLMQKICDTASENPPKEISPKETTRNCGGSDIDPNKSETLASVSERSSHYDLQPTESIVQANVADKQKICEKFAEVPHPWTELVNSTLGDVHLCLNPETAAEHCDSSICEVNDASHENKTKTDVDARTDQKLSETDEHTSHNRIHEAPIQLHTKTAVKDPTDPKRKRKIKKKVSRNKERYANSRADNQPKESTVKETTSNSNDFGNEFGIAASIKESSQTSTGQHVEGLLQANVDDTHIGKNRAENIARLDNDIKENAPTKKRRYKIVVRKILSSRFENQTKKSNEDELAPAFVQSEKNDGNGSNMHDTEKAKSGSHTKDDSNVNLDNTKTSPVVKKRLVF